MPIIIHPLDYLGRQAIAPKQLKIIDAKQLESLRKAFVNFVKEIAVEGVLTNEVKVKQALQAHGLTESLILPTFSTEP